MSMLSFSSVSKRVSIFFPLLLDFDFLAFEMLRSYLQILLMFLTYSFLSFSQSMTL